MDSDMIYDFPCTSCQENGMNSDSVSYCQQCEKLFCNVCIKMHDRILKEHKVLDESLQHLWSKEKYDTIVKENDDGNDTVRFVQDNIPNESQHKLSKKENDSTNINIASARDNIAVNSQQELLTQGNGRGYTSAHGIKTKITGQDIDRDRNDITQAKEVICEVSKVRTTLCGIVGKTTVYLDDMGIRIFKSDRKAYLEIPIHMIKNFGRKKTFMFYFDVGKCFCFGEGFIIIKCS
ncbi:hypothetical protein MAR_003409 [Mya arenaria]|uniref:B box-type domain-containing protein n=1 Tax=Mya arenaria TaxID=6604 RepID=A0ABY7G9R2_MYAAR|nr:hypothetical protein MAR_003409 [Mya arenaria]